MKICSTSTTVTGKLYRGCERVLGLAMGLSMSAFIPFWNVGCSAALLHTNSGSARQYSLPRFDSPLSSNHLPNRGAFRRKLTLARPSCDRKLVWKGSSERLGRQRSCPRLHDYLFWVLRWVRFENRREPSSTLLRDHHHHVYLNQSMGFDFFFQAWQNPF